MRNFFFCGCRPAGRPNHIHANCTLPTPLRFFPRFSLTLDGLRRCRHRTESFSCILSTWIYLVGHSLRILARACCGTASPREAVRPSPCGRCPGAVNSAPGWHVHAEQHGQQPCVLQVFLARLRQKTNMLLPETWLPGLMDTNFPEATSLQVLDGCAVSLRGLAPSCRIANPRSIGPARCASAGVMLTPQDSAGSSQQQQCCSVRRFEVDVRHRERRLVLRDSSHPHLPEHAGPKTNVGKPIARFVQA